MSDDTKSLCEIIGYVTVYATWPFIFGAGALGASAAISAFKASRDMISTYYNPSKDVRRDKTYDLKLKRHLEFKEVFLKYFYQDSGLDQKHPI